MQSPTYTIIAGNKACPNNCPICISKMTPDYGIGYNNIEVNWRKFDDATRISLRYGAKNVLITGKGEPTIFPGQITQYLIKLYQKPFALRELQTEGSLLVKGGFYTDFLDAWKELGLNTVSISIYHYNKGKNKEMFKPKSGEYFELSSLIDKLHTKDFNVRLSCVMLKEYIDSIDEVRELVAFAKSNEVFELTLRRADRPEKTLDDKIAEFVDNHRLTKEQFLRICDFFKKEGKYCYSLAHDASIYEFNGQNVCISTGLTPVHKDKEIMRQFIFFPQGWLTTSWENVRGGRLL